jgi:hypothetical protein
MLEGSQNAFEGAQESGWQEGGQEDADEASARNADASR